jgi:hypothetical protein
MRPGALAGQPGWAHWLGALAGRTGLAHWLGAARAGWAALIYIYIYILYIRICHIIYPHIASSRLRPWLAMVKDPAAGFWYHSGLIFVPQQLLSGAPWGCVGLPRAAWGCLGFLGAPGSFLGLPRAPLGCLGLSALAGRTDWAHWLGALTGRTGWAHWLGAARAG